MDVGSPMGATGAGIMPQTAQLAPAKQTLVERVCNLESELSKLQMRHNEHIANYEALVQAYHDRLNRLEAEAGVA